MYSAAQRTDSSAPTVLKHAGGRALAVAGIKSIVTHKPLRTLNDWYEFLAYPAVDLCTVLWIKVIMTNNGKHDVSPSLNFPISTFFCLSRQARIGHANSKNAVNF